jgi:hypothetical protein
MGKIGALNNQLILSALNNKQDKQLGYALSMNDLSDALKLVYDNYQAQINSKVNIQDGFGLSKNDFTDLLKIKLDNIPTSFVPSAFGENWRNNIFFGGTPGGDFIGATINGGAIGTMFGEGVSNAYYPYGVIYQSSATANSGYRILTNSLISRWFGAISSFHQGVFMLPNSPAPLRIQKQGYFNVNNFTATITNGVYVLLQADTITFKAIRVGGSSYTSTNTFTLTRGVQYLYSIEVEPIGNKAILNVYTYSNGSIPVFTDQILSTSNAIPNLPTQVFGEGMVGGSTGTAIQFMCFWYAMNSGSKAGYERRG